MIPCRTVLPTGIALALVLGSAAQDASVKLPDWDGAPLTFTVYERFLVKMESRVALEVDVATDGAWTPSGAASNCVKRTDEGRPYVRFGGDDKRVGLAHGVRPAKSAPLAAGSACTLEVAVRVAHRNDTLIVYAHAYDKEGRDVTATVPAPAGWTYSDCSRCYAKYPISLDVSGEWTTLKVPFRMPDGVASFLPTVCPWRGGGADVRGMRIIEGTVPGARAVAFDVPAEQAGRTTRFRSERDSLALEVTVGPIGTFEAEVRDLSEPPRPRALDLAVNVPASLEGWTWHRNWRDDRKIAIGSKFDDDKQVGGFPVTRYPFSAVSKDGAGFVFGTPFDAGVYESRAVTASGITSRVPIGLLARGAGLGRRATFRYMLFPFKGTWGFRSAAKAYYAREGHKLPAASADAKEGTWVWPIWPSKGPPDPDDFGHAFWEAPASVEKTPEEIRRAHELGIGVFPYTEVWGMRQNMTTAADGSHPPLAARLAELETWAAQANSDKTWFDAPRDEAARACLNSMPMQPDGSHAYAEDHYASWTTWWRTNPDPRITRPNRCSICWDRLLAPRLDDIDGVYLDSVAYGFSVDFRNVRPEHLAVFDAPLVYDLDTLRPCADGMQHMTTFIGWLAGKLHPKGKRLFGNTFGIAHRFNATNLDIFGCEVGSWGTRPGEKHLHSVITDDDACEQRFFAYHRPVSNLLQEGHWERLCPEISRRGMELYIENQMFYGFYPAVSTIGGEKKIGYVDWTRYFDKSKRYERDRDLFKSAIPVIRRLNRAGWQPETLMRADDPHVWIERYGEPEASGECLFAVRNASDKTVDTILTPEFQVSALVPAWRGSVAAPVGTNGFAVRLDPWQTVVFQCILFRHARGEYQQNTSVRRPATIQYGPKSQNQRPFSARRRMASEK